MFLQKQQANKELLIFSIKYIHLKYYSKYREVLCRSGVVRGLLKNDSSNTATKARFKMKLLYKNLSYSRKYQLSELPALLDTYLDQLDIKYYFSRIHIAIAFIELQSIQKRSITQNQIVYQQTNVHNDINNTLEY